LQNGFGKHRMNGVWRDFGKRGQHKVAQMKAGMQLFFLSGELLNEHVL
jgi:hypothetical protein